MARFTDHDIAEWREHGGTLLEKFFTDEEVAAVAADFRTVFAQQHGAQEAKVAKAEGSIGRFDAAQFATFEAIPFDCSPALNLIGVHPELIRFAKQALASDKVHLYQCQVWAKFTGEADYDQPFHTDFANHTLTVPSEDETRNSITILCYFSDVTDAHGAMHYVRRSDSEKIAGPEASISRDPAGFTELQQALQQHERSSASPAGSIFPYSIDVYHRGTNMTAPGGHRYAVMVCYKAAGDDSIGYHAWPFHHLKPWAQIFNHATPEQLECFGVAPPGDPFWTDITLQRAQRRYPDWDLQPYRQALAKD